MKWNRTRLSLGIALAIIWAAVGAVMWLTADQVSSPERVLAALNDPPWKTHPNLRDDLRVAALDKIIALQNRLDLDQRRRLREDGEEVMKAFFDSLSDSEKHQYVDGTVEPSLRKVVSILDAMKPEDRKAISARLRREFGRRPGAPRTERRPEDGSPQNATDPAPSDGLEEWLGLGLEMQYQDATIERKLEMAQMFENVQAFLQGFRR